MKSLVLCSTQVLYPEVQKTLSENGIETVIAGHSEVTNTETGNLLPHLHGVIVFTSRHAVKSLLLSNFDRKKLEGIFCLSGATLSAAKEAAIPILGIGNDAASLAFKIIESGIRNVTFLTAENHRPELPKILREYGVDVRILVVYSVKHVAQQVSDPYDGVLFFSPGSANAFLKKNKLPTNATCFCIGQTTAQFLRARIKQRIVVSPFPSHEQMARQVILYAEAKKNKNEPDAVAKAI